MPSWRARCSARRLTGLLTLRTGILCSICESVILVEAGSVRSSSVLSGGEFPFSVSVMLVFSMSQLLSLARIYAAGTGVSLQQLGERMTGNWKFFPRLAQGAGCSARASERASLWFVENWPAGVD